ncbi:MAG: DUF4280 domain-containing protein [Polyangiaceae bacterium]
MPKLVVLGAKLKCSQGLSTSTLNLTPAVVFDRGEKPTATVEDHKPIANIPPFGMCKSPANPQVAAATAAAMGTLTPQPCIPIVPAQWVPGSQDTIIAEQAALTADSKCMCVWAGTIEITDPATDVQAGEA